jgi:hypothetical protein
MHYLSIIIYYSYKPFEDQKNLKRAASQDFAESSKASK